MHHTDRGSQYTSIAFSERLAEAGIQPSVGAAGSSYDNALAETINALYKAELIKPRGPWHSVDHVEFAPAEWVDWFNHRRLYRYCGDIPPAEMETLDKQPSNPPGSHTDRSPDTPGRFTVLVATASGVGVALIDNSVSKPAPKPKDYTVVDHNKPLDDQTGGLDDLEEPTIDGPRSAKTSSTIPNLDREPGPRNSPPRPCGYPARRRMDRSRPRQLTARAAFAVRPS